MEYKQVDTEKIAKFFDSLAAERDTWKKKNQYYHSQIERLFQFIIPQEKKVLEIGCGTGDLLASVKPKLGVGIDISGKMIDIAKSKYRKLHFKRRDGHNLNIHKKFDYIILSDVIGNFEDVQQVFEEVYKISNNQTKVVISHYNFLWEPVLNLAQRLGLMMPHPRQNWLTDEDIANLLSLANLEIVKKGSILLLPIKVPLISSFINRFIARLPLLKKLCLISYFVVRKNLNLYSNYEYSVSVIIPARNEQGNIEQTITRLPKLGSKTEVIFVEGNSEDNTLGEIKRVANKYRNKMKIKIIKQEKGIGKGDAVRRGFAKAKGEILMILDADLTVAPEDLLKFYRVIKSGKAEFVMGSRLVYPMEKEAMRYLNILGNKFFSLTFSFLLDQNIKDTLCGTKVLFKKDYHEIANNRSYFGNFDPFGDFDLIFGASKLNLKIVEVPIRYRARTYGTTNISRFKHGLLLLKMAIFAAKKIKFIQL